MPRSPLNKTQNFNSPSISKYMFRQQVVPIHFPNPKLNPRLKSNKSRTTPTNRGSQSKITVKRTKIHKIPKSPHSVNNQSKASKLNPSIRTHIPHTQNYFASCKTNNHPTTPILRPPPPTQVRTQHKRLKSGNSVRNHH